MKGDSSNYKGVSVLLNTYKILSNILLPMFTLYVEEIIGAIIVVFETTGKLLILYYVSFKQGIPVAFEYIINL